MQGFRQHQNTLVWERNHETLQIEPWGRDSLRVRSTISAGIRDDLLSVLLSPAETHTQITMGAGEATIRNGAISASISAEGCIRFSNTASDAELLAEEQPEGIKL
jgi:alpha-D-xyloside xylohydrolase